MKQFFRILIVLMCGGLLVLSLLLVCGCENKTANPGKDVLAATESQKTPIPTTTPRPTFAPMPTPVPADTDISSRDHIYDYNAFELPTPEKLRKAVIHEDFIVDRTINGDGTLKRYAEGTNALGDVRGDEVEFYPDGTIKSWHHMTVLKLCQQTITIINNIYIYNCGILFLYK